jgi:TPP-dependent trihydroxycyclohexane-1,2-dione (THcHDO) dehydratase
MEDFMTDQSVTGAMYIAHSLRNEGVEMVFGQCGHTNYALIDACQRVGIEYISFRHEQQAVHAADAYYRLSKKLAVINVHLSPGLTNALTGVVSAATDGTPMLVIAGNTPTYHHPREAHQVIRLHADASQGDIFRPICKRVWRIDIVDHLRDVMHRALNIAQTGRSGAVLLDVPMDMFSAKLSAPLDSLSRRPNYPRSVGDPAGLATAADLLLGAGGQGGVPRDGPAVGRHHRHLGRTGGERDDPERRRRPGGRHRLRRSGLQLLAARAHLRHPRRDEADPDRHRPPGTGQELSGRHRHRR